MISTNMTFIEVQRAFFVLSRQARWICDFFTHTTFDVKNVNYPT